jgi:hypothetical protein
MHLNRIMPKKAKKAKMAEKANARSCIGPFVAGQYKSPNPETYRHLCVCESIIQEDVMKLRALTSKTMKTGMTVKAKYMLGRFVGQWYECVLVEKIKGGWTVAWCDGTKNDTRKTLGLIRLKCG